MKAPFTTAFVGFTGVRFDANLGTGNRRMPRARPESHCTAKKNANQDEIHTSSRPRGLSRRSLLHSAGLSVAGTVTSGPLSALFRLLINDDEQPATMVSGVDAANAIGLVQFPCPVGTLANTYHMMRAGQSGLEAEDVLSSNPLFLTNREDALTDLGRVQVEDVCQEMMSRGINPSVVKYSLAAKCIDTANIVATTMLIGRNRIVPEFTFMDARGVGVWDKKPLASTEAAVWAMDAAEAGNEGRDGKPPPNDDGTANETLHEQVIRLRQLMSVLETQYSGDTILLVFPDGTSPALLSCLMAGIPLKNTHALNFAPGEFREDVNMDNANQLLKERLPSPKYNEVLAMGKDELEQLRKEHRENLFAEEGSHSLLVAAPKQSDLAPKVQSRRTFGDEQVRPDILSAGAMGAMGGLFMVRGDNDDKYGSKSKTESAPAPMLAYANSTGTTVLEQQVDTIYASANTFQMADAVTNPNVFQDVSLVPKQDRIEAAEMAMEEYLSQDDGGDDWLTAMQDIAME